ncbi:MAG: hypothetical protein V5A43_05130 [Haloarculaceae archaeon]
MNRRTLLRRIGALGAIGLAGCAAGPDGDGDGSAGDGDGSPGDGDGSPGDREGTPDSSGTTTTPGPVSIADRSIRTITTECRGTGAETATVAIDRDETRVTVTGSIHTPDPCYEARLSDLAYDAATRTLSLDVVAEDTGEVCVQCTGRVAYEATIDLAGGVPDRVEITHAGRSVHRGEDGTDDSTSESVDESGGSDDVSESDGPSPVLESARIEPRQTDAAPATGEGGDIEFDPEAGEIVATGWVEARNGCERPTIADARYVASEETFDVAVVAAEPPHTTDEACTQVVEALPYRATFAFADEIPSAVSLTQEGYGGAAAGYSTASASEPTTTAEE